MQDNLIIYHDLIEGIVTAMDMRDHYTASHSERVSAVSQQICQMLKLPKRDTETIHIAAHLHDIGKIGVPDSVLRKASALTKEEWTQMKCHCEIGYQILSKVKGFETVAQIVRHHHERWDGRGYAIGLKGAEIPLGARVIALADSIDAMLSNRSYRNSFTLLQCKAEIAKNSGAMYDPEITGLVLKQWETVTAIYS